MTVSQKEQLMSLLFREDIKPLNLKFFRFGCDPVTEDDLCAEFTSALLQKRDGNAVVTDAFPESVEPVNANVMLVNR